PLFACGAGKYCTVETQDLETSARELLRISYQRDSLCSLFSRHTDHFDPQRNFFLLYCNHSCVAPGGRPKKTASEPVQSWPAICQHGHRLSACCRPHSSTGACALFPKSLN